MPQTKFFRDSKALALSVPHRCAQQSRQAVTLNLIARWMNVSICSPTWMPRKNSLISHTLRLGAQVGVTPNSDGPRENLMRCSIWS
jgi:hypothetical protein